MSAWKSVWKKVASRNKGADLHLSSGYGNLTSDEYEKMVLEIVEPLDLDRPSMKIVELGCAAGAFIAVLQKHYPQHEYSGLDYSESSIQRAREVFDDTENFWVASLLDSPDSDKVGTYDVVICNGVFIYLESLRDIFKALRNVIKWCKPGGSFCISQVSDEAKKSIAEDLRSKSLYFQQKQEKVSEDSPQHLYIPKLLFQDYQYLGYTIKTITNDVECAYAAYVEQAAYRYSVYATRLLPGEHLQTYMKNLFFLPRSNLLVMYKLVSDVTSILDKYTIRYFIDGGTLLGAVRHRGQIPWDDDADLGILKNDYDRIVGLKEVFQTHGYIFVEAEKGYMCKVYSEAMCKASVLKQVSFPCCDFFTYCETGGAFHLESLSHQLQWPACRHLNTDLFPLRQYEFGPFKVWGPRNPYPYVNGLYPGWMSTALIEMRTGSDKSKTTELPMSVMRQYETPVTQSELEAFEVPEEEPESTDTGKASV